jgi:hypothetical protein
MKAGNSIIARAVSARLRYGSAQAISAQTFGENFSTLIKQ